MWNRSRLMRGSFWSAWKSRMSMRSTASRRRSRSGRRTPRGIRARPWRLRPSCTIFCGCCGRARAGPIARTAASTWSAIPWIRWPREMLAQPEGSRWYALFPMPRQRRTPRRCATTCSICARRASTGCFRVGKMFEFSTPESLLDVDFSKPVFVAGGPPGDLAGHCASAWWTPSRSAIAKPGKSSFEAGRPGDRRFASTRSSPASYAARTSSSPSRACSASTIPFGACQRCQGFGNTIDYDMDLVIPNRALSIEQGAVDPWTKPQYSGFGVDFRKDYARARCG